MSDLNKIEKHKRRLRNLPQYKKMSDEEFDKLYEVRFLEKADGIVMFKDNNSSEDDIRKHIKELGKDYDLSMNYNDKLQLRAWALANIRLESIEKELALITMDGFEHVDINKYDKLNRFANDLRVSISKVLDDLSLTRRIRKQSSEESVIGALELIKEKARAFYKDTMVYMFCTKCNRLLGTVWLNYPDSPARLKIICKNCKHHENQRLNDLYKTRNTNKKDAILP